MDQHSLFGSETLVRKFTPFIITVVFFNVHIRWRNETSVKLTVEFQQKRFGFLKNRSSANKKIKRVIAVSKTYIHIKK